MTDEQKMKSEFVKRELLALLRRTETDVQGLEYGIANGNEIVTIIYNNNYRRNVCVNCDSKRAIAMDVLRALD